MKRSGKGFSLLELVLAMSAAGILVLGTLGLFRFILDLHFRLQVEEMETLAVYRLRGLLEKAWWHRCSHPFQEHPWLEVRTRAVDGTFELLSWQMVVHDEKGDATEWRLLREDNGYRVAQGGRVGGVVFREEIHLDGPGGSWDPGKEPERVLVSFPGLKTAKLRRGFAIEAN